MTARGGRGRGRVGGRGRNAGRGKPKTADELDAEMVDYFDTNGTNGGADGPPATNGTVGANAAEDLGMDEISVCFQPKIASQHANLFVVRLGILRRRIRDSKLRSTRVIYDGHWRCRLYALKDTSLFLIKMFY